VIAWVLKVLKPLLIWLGQQRLLIKYAKVKPHHILEMIDTLQEGDVILTTTWGEFSNIVNWGTFKHAIMYTGANTIIHSIGTGTVKGNFTKEIKKKYRVIVLRSKVHTKEEIIKAVDNMRGRVGNAYDYAFNPDNSEDYCSESIFKSYTEAAPQHKLKCEEVAGLHIIKPGHFKEDTGNWATIYRV
jgi:uncharacterized protein YycO